jgi:hypothetical protein
VFAKAFRSVGPIEALRRQLPELVGSP